LLLTLICTLGRHLLLLLLLMCLLLCMLLLLLCLSMLLCMLCFCMRLLSLRLCQLLTCRPSIPHSLLLYLHGTFCGADILHNAHHALRHFWLALTEITDDQI
jgi:hypothetical protein